MEEVNVLAKAIIELREFMTAIADAVIANSNAAIQNSELLMKIESYVDSVAEFTIEAYTGLTTTLSMVGGMAIENTSRLNELEVMLYDSIEALDILYYCVIGSLGLGTFNTVLIIALFVMVLRQKKCMCLKPKEKLKQIRKNKK
ncbi:MAG: hypothetical protein DRO67_09055 [Candidatus Asgardarchaeum californiense]|nr:MAG: hypothetical protein DRO67_09055 [Candidatus Asgardarchaeum californiense]